MEILELRQRCSHAVGVMNKKGTAGEKTWKSLLTSCEVNRAIVTMKIDMLNDWTWVEITNPLSKQEDWIDNEDSRKKLCTVV